MTYSFSGIGPSKSEAILDLDWKLDKLVADMPIHERDKALIERQVRDAVQLLDEPDYSEKVMISIHGYIGQTPVGIDGKRVTAINWGITASLVAKR